MVILFILQFRIADFAFISRQRDEISLNLKFTIENIAKLLYTINILNQDAAVFSSAKKFTNAMPSAS